MDMEPIGDELKRHFRTEMINRIDEVIRFRPLSSEAMNNIAVGMLEEIAAGVVDKYGRAVEFAEGLAAYLAEKAYSPEFGARNLRRVVQEEVELPLARRIASSTKQTAIRCALKSGAVRCEES